jgi:hypothetical protein
MKLSDGVTKFRLGVWAPGASVPSASDARSLSRVFGPFNEMMREDARLEVVRPPVNLADPNGPPDWDFVSGLDCLYLLDPVTKWDLRLLHLARACGVSVWVDYIDDHQNVPASNPHYAMYADKVKIRANLAEMIAGAQVVTTTTFTLKCRLPGGDKAMVLPEACRWPQCDLPRQRVVTWRGSPTHAEDIESVLPQLAEVANLPQFSLWKWAFFGFDQPDWRIAKAFRNPAEQVLWIPWLPPYDFINEWGNLAPYLHIAPIVDSLFNRCKSPLVWLEATAIGAAVIGPTLPEWNVCNGLVRYSTPENFGEVLRREMQRFEDGKLNEFAVVSRKEVYPAKTSRAVNAMRWAIVNNLAEGRTSQRDVPTKEKVAA